MGTAQRPRRAGPWNEDDEPPARGPSPEDPGRVQQAAAEAQALSYVSVVMDFPAETMERMTWAARMLNVSLEDFISDAIEARILDVESRDL